VVTAADFPDGGQRAFGSLALSPDGERLIFDTSLSGHTTQLWIMSLAGGSPIRLTNGENDEYGPSWSPDGSQCAFVQRLGSKYSLMTVKTSGNAAPVELRKDVLFYDLNWSPTGEWISYRDDRQPGLWNQIKSAFGFGNAR
jgi:TolB protein